jgi:hypothetical protein
MIWVHEGDFSPYGSLVGSYVTDNFSASVYHTENYTAVVLNEDMKAGEIDMRDLFDYLIDIGIVSSDEYLASVELGAEVVSGAGSLTIDHLDIALNEAAHTAYATQAIESVDIVQTSSSMAEIHGQMATDSHLSAWHPWGVDSFAA